MSGYDFPDEALPLPAELERYTVGFSMDIGGSINKLMYCSKDTASPTADGKSRRLRVATLPRDNISGVRDFLKERCANRLEHVDPITVKTTGVGVKQFGRQIKDTLNIRYDNATEMDCFSVGFRYFAKHLSEEELFYTVPSEVYERALPTLRCFLPMLEMSANAGAEDGLFEGGFGEVVPQDVINAVKEQLKDAQSLEAAHSATPLQFPCALVMCGSGAAIMKLPSADPATKYSVINYTPQAGTHMLGLGRLLTGAKTYDELLTLASEGNAGNVNTKACDTKGEVDEDFYGMFHDDVTLFTFGKGVQKDLGDFSRADLAAAVVQASVDHLVAYVLAQCQLFGARQALFCGGMVAHPHARNVLAQQWLDKTTMEVNPDRKVSMKVVKVGSYLGALGSWLLGMEDESKDSSKADDKS